MFNNKEKKKIGYVEKLVKEKIKGKYGEDKGGVSY